MPLKTFSLAGVFYVSGEDGATHNLKLPGTLDESNIGHRDKKNAGKGLMEKLGPATSSLDRVFTDDDLVFPETIEEDPDENIYSRFTRKYTYEGPVRIYRMLNSRENAGKRLFFDVERARVLSLFIDGEEIPAHRSATLLSEQSFEVTGKMNGSHILSLISDNSYPGLPAALIKGSNMASDDTQTNWNGLLGYVRLRQEEMCFIERVTAYPKADSLSVYVEISCGLPGDYEIAFVSDALQREYRKKLHIEDSFFCFQADGLKYREGVERWDEGDGKLYELSVLLNGEGRSVSFGIRDFHCDDTYFYLNGRRMFLRGETNCAVHPETSYAPMDKDAWIRKLQAIRDYGANFVRFKSHCPPEAAFQAADELGMLLMPELSLSGEEDAFSQESAQKYYKSELLQLLRCYGSHPSFVMLSLGDHLRLSHESLVYAKELLDLAHRVDPSKLCTISSGEPRNGNGLVLSQEDEKLYFDTVDFLLSPRFGLTILRGCDHASREENGLKGFVNNEYPGSLRNFDEELESLREKVKKPFISAEAGGYAILPDLREISYFSGFLEPLNLMKMRDDAERAGLLPNWDRLLSVSGETALTAYRMEIAAAFRTEKLAGITLRALQDEPGNHSALYGMMNSHMLPKPAPFSDPKRFSGFFGPLVPLLLTEKFCYEAGESFRFRVRIANYTREDQRLQLSFSLRSDEGVAKGTLKELTCPAGAVTEYPEELELSLLSEDAKRPVKYTFTLRAGRVENSWQIYAFPKVLPLCPMDVYESDSLNATAVLMLKEGGKVLLTPRAVSEILPESVHSEFSTDYVSSVRYPRQSGQMGRLPDSAHPLFRDYPLEEWGGIHFWQMSLGRAVLLPRRMKCIVAALDSIHTLRPMAEMIEFRCLNGTVLLCSMGLKNHMDRPEVRYLVSEIYRYMESFDFSPSQELKLSELQAIVRA